MDEILTNFVEKIGELQRPELIHVDDGDGERTYSSKPIHPVFDPEPKVLHLNTLTGLVNYVSHNVDGIDFEDAMVHVVSHDEVELISSLQGDFAQRFRFAVANCTIKPFPFGQFMRQEDFMIRLQCDFVHTNVLEIMAQYAGNVVNENIKTLADDGISQRATVKTGVSSSMRKNEVAPRTIRLRPYRTFHEVEQCESDFVFRMRQFEAEADIEMALFSASADRWRLEAVQEIVKWLEVQMPSGLGIIM